MKDSTFNTNRGMKTKRFGKMAVMMAVILIALCTSCKKIEVTYISNRADFAVTNLRTNETVNGSANPMEVHRNDSLLLVYKKPQEYANSIFTITFNAFGREYIGQSVSGRQYQNTIVVESSLADSTYFIQCNGVSADWEEGSWDRGSVTVRVTE